MTPQKLVFEQPLYETSRINSGTALRSLFIAGMTRVDGHCFQCSRDSVFHSTGVSTDKELRETAYLQGTQIIVFECQRDSSHQVHVVIYSELGTEPGKTPQTRLGILIPTVLGEITKIGQLPSHADIANADLKGLSKTLEDIDRREFIRANGLAAHGVNIGAFVYLRRVFERLVWRARKSVPNAGPDRDFAKLRMDEKIGALKKVLPSFLVKNRKVYAVLSQGIHELDEDTCGRYYELLRKSVTLMLEQEREIQDKIRLESELSALLGQIEPQAKS